MSAYPRDEDILIGMCKELRHMLRDAQAEAKRNLRRALKAEKQARHLDAKINHGCTDSHCDLCDGRRNR